MGDKIAEIRERCEAATEPPWRYSETGIVFGPKHCVAQAWNKYEEDYPNAEANGTFIAAAREDVPWLLDQIATLTARLQAAEAERDAMQRVSSGARRWRGQDVSMDTTAALVLARWILDTFGDDEAPTP